MLVFRERSLLNAAPALFGEGGKEYLGLKGGEYGEIQVPAGAHQFETWAYYGWREEWRPHATLDLQVKANTRTCIETRIGTSISAGFFGSLVEALTRPFTSAYSMAVVPCANAPPSGYHRHGAG